MQSYLITGSDKQGRLVKAEEIIGQSISSLINHPDFTLLKTLENSIGIDEIRNLQKNLSLKPYVEKRKIFLIENAQDLTLEAQNCLLKTLEEPPADCLILLTAFDASSLLPTIVSRCSIIQLPAKMPITIDEEEEKTLTVLFEKILASSEGKKLKISETEVFFKDRKTATETLDKLTIIIRKIMLDNYRQKNNHFLDFPLIFSLLFKAKSLLSANVNTKLVIDNFLFSLPSQSSIINY